MKQRKKIDDIYRDNLRSVNTPPPADSWDYISGRLPRKEEKTRVLPLWLKLSGAAAALVLLFSLFMYAPVSPLETEENPISDRPAEVTPGPGSTSTAYEETDEDDSEPSGSGEEVNSKQNSGTAASTATDSAIGFSETTESSSTTAETDTRTAESPEAPMRDTGSEMLTGIAETTGISPEPYKKTVPTQITPENSPEADALAAANEDLQSLKKENFTKETEEKTSFLKRFRISTTAAAVYFDKLGNGNTVDDQFANNSANGEVSASYGINVSYGLADRVKIRSGVNKVNLNYNIQNVDYQTAMQSESINADAAAEGLVLSSGMGSLEQELGFIEIPMEVEYAVIDQRVGLNLIGGASTFFLQDNDITHTTMGYSTSLGEARNLNEISFSANLGLGLHYNISDRFRLNLEPVFKYQINTFRNVSGLNSYYFGIYSGLSYQF